MLQSIFSTPISVTDTDIPEDCRRSMLSYIDDLLNDNDIGQSDVQGLSSKNNLYKHITIHQLPEFEWLNQQIKEQCYHYLLSIGVDTDTVTCYVQKSWAVVKTGTDFTIREHDHTGSTLSAVFYLNSNGDVPLVFTNHTSLLSQLPIHSYTQTEHNTTYSGIQSQTGRLLLFPSNLKHFVPNNTQSVDRRISISYDIVVTVKKEKNADSLGNHLIDPHYWKELN